MAERLTGRPAERLRTESVDVGYGARAVISGVDLEVRAGEVAVLIGPNGAGKSTVLKTISKQIEPLGGSVFVAGRELAALSVKELALEMAVVLTERLRTDLMTCADVVESGRYPHTGRLGVLRDGDRAAVRQAMELVHVLELAERDFMQVSDGQRQRVLLARAIAQQPNVILLDEPTSFLDIRYQVELIEVLRFLAREQGVGVIMSLHELNLARIAADKLVCIKDGGVFAKGTPEEIFQPSVIDALYDLKPGTYDPATGEIRLGSGVEVGADAAASAAANAGAGAGEGADEGASTSANAGAGAGEGAGLGANTATDAAEGAGLGANTAADAGEGADGTRIAAAFGEDGLHA